MFRPLMVSNETIVANRNMAVEAVILQILTSMNVAEKRFMDGDFLRRFLKIIQLYDLMILKAAHILVSIITTSAQKVSAIIATRNGILLTLA